MEVIVVTKEEMALTDCPSSRIWAMLWLDLSLASFIPATTTPTSSTAFLETSATREACSALSVALCALDWALSAISPMEA